MLQLLFLDIVSQGGIGLLNHLQKGEQGGQRKFDAK